MKAMKAAMLVGLGRKSNVKSECTLLAICDTNTATFCHAGHAELAGLTGAQMWAGCSLAPFPHVPGIHHPSNVSNNAT